MTNFPDKAEQIRQAHAGLIHRVVIGCQNRALVPDLDNVLGVAERNGWTQLVAVIRRILGGERDERVLSGLDAEDRTIAESILRGLQDPQTLPALDARPDPAAAAPGLAGMIHAARTGNTEALQLIAGMATQMMEGGGDMARLAAIIRPLISGERDPDRLCKGMTSEGEALVMAILKELAALEAH